LAKENEVVLKAIALLCVTVLATWSTLSSADELTPERILDIKMLMSIGMPKEGDVAVFSRQVDKALWMLKQQHPELSEQTRQSMHDEAIRLFQVKRDEPGGLTDRLVAIYHKHLSHDDVKQILQFFDTPIGQKVKGLLATRQIEALPIVEQWMDEVTRAWVQSMMETLMKQAMPPADGSATVTVSRVPAAGRAATCPGSGGAAATGAITEAGHAVVALSPPGRCQS
jgi:hypothetical protein